MSNSVHVCLVSCYPPSTGPLSEYAHHLVISLLGNPRISRITVLSDTVSEHEEAVPEKKIEIIRCWKLNDALTPMRITKKISEVSPDVVHFNLLFRQFSLNRIVNFFGLCTPAMTTLFGLPVVVTLHSIAEAINLQDVGYDNSLVNKLGCRLATKLLLRSDVVVVTHQQFASILREKYHAGNVTHIPHGAFYEPGVYTHPARKRLLFFGKMGQYKNLPLALDAFNEVRRRDDEAELVIAGPPHPLEANFLRSSLKAAENTRNVTVLGYVNEEEIPTLFASCAAVVLPYRIPTWSSGVFSLACSHGRAVIASNLPDFRSLQQEGAGIMLVPRDDREALANAMDSILHDVKLQRKLGEANLAWARRNNFKQFSDRLVDIFQKIA